MKFFDHSGCALTVGGVIAIAVVLPIAPVNSPWWKVANRVNDDFRSAIPHLGL